MDASKDALTNDLSVRNKAQSQHYLSSTMLQLHKVLQSADNILFERISYASEMTDLHESLMLLYVAVLLNNKRVFAHVSTLTQEFALQPEWHALFQEPEIFEKAQSL